MTSVKRRSGSSLSLIVYDAIRDSLRKGEYRPGDRLREEEVAQRLNVSRTPVREALGRLQARRLLETAGGRGLVVRRLEVGDVMELYTMREIIEGASARLAADHASVTEIDALQDLNGAFEAAADDPAEMFRVNRLFHAAIYRAARNRYLDFALDEIQDSISLLGSTTFVVQQRVAIAGGEHRAIIDAIVRRDQAEAEEQARAHIRGALRARLRLLQNT